ncbi:MULTISPECIES: DMT family transporter [Stutzerimonas]|jgi:drug/metabolite transporter (DMT)-like permease|uniref:EamA-like transporter family protein n=1 Tax=Stutzerimonas stutzeri TaxID=316 RepID=A0A5S5BK70_STUST|nr:MULTISPECIES: DMT family transporter [Stutzerimonas]MDX2350935.1 DMT family transporter [Stutzerimonas xanthomarina]TYP66500.1 EamA-like transporter family protein [Stutzerimonas stutzeri]
MTLLPQILLVTGAVAWGLGWLPLHHFASVGLVGMPLVLLVYGLLSLFAIPVLWFGRRAWMPQRNGLLAIVVCGGGATAALVTALAIGEVVRVMLLFYLAPVWGVLGGWLLLGERLTPLRIGALLLAMLGIALTLNISSALTHPLSGSDWLALAAGLGFSLNNLATRAADQVPLASKTLAPFLGSALIAVVLCPVLGEYPPPLSLTLSWQIGLMALGWLLSMAAVQYGVSHIEAGRAAVLVVFELVAAVLSSAWLGNQAIGTHEWLGAALVMVAALTASWPERPALTVIRSPSL